MMVDSSSRVGKASPVDGKASRVGVEVVAEVGVGEAERVLLGEVTVCLTMLEYLQECKR